MAVSRLTRSGVRFKQVANLTDPKLCVKGRPRSARCSAVPAVHTLRRGQVCAGTSARLCDVN